MLKFFYKKDIKTIDEFNSKYPNILFNVTSIKDIKRNKVIIESFNNVFGQKNNFTIDEILNDIYKSSRPKKLLCYKYGIDFNDDFENSIIDKFKINLVIDKLNEIQSILGFSKIEICEDLDIKIIILGIANKLNIPYNGNYQIDDVYNYLIGVHLSEELHLEVINGYI